MTERLQSAILFLRELVCIYALLHTHMHNTHTHIHHTHTHTHTHIQTHTTHNTHTTHTHSGLATAEAVTNPLKSCGLVSDTHTQREREREREKEISLLTIFLIGYVFRR